MAKGAEAFELATVMFEIQSEKKKQDLYSLRLTALISIIYTIVNIILTEA